MKTFKKVLALVTAVVMAISMNAFALNIGYKETINSVGAWYSASNDNYMCIMQGNEKYEGYERTVVHVYKNVDGGWKHWATVSPHANAIGGTVPFDMRQLAVTSDNTLLILLFPHAGQGIHMVVGIDLDNLAEGTEHKNFDTAYTASQRWGQNINKFMLIGNYIFVPVAGDGSILIYDINGNLVDSHTDATTAVDAWEVTRDNGYTYKINDDGNVALYDANVWVYDNTQAAIDYTDLKFTLQNPNIEKGVCTVAVTGNYAGVISNEGIFYSYDLTKTNEDGVVPYTEGGPIYGSYGSMDVNGKYAAVYSRSSGKLSIFNLENAQTENSFDTPTSDGNISLLEFNDSGVLIAHGDGKMDFYSIETGVDMIVDLTNAEYNEDYTKLKVNVTINNYGLEETDGYVIFASYEDEKLVDISIKPLKVAIGAPGDVTTEYIIAASTLKAFYLTAEGEPIVPKPFVDIYKE